VSRVNAFQCDDGNKIKDDGCSNRCRLGDGQPCTRNDQCESNICKDGVCMGRNICGNGVVEAGEGCDDGNRNDTDQCSNSCKLGDGEQCTHDDQCASNICKDGICVGADICGNGALEAGEQCDDGNVFPGDGCSPTCTLEPTLVAGGEFCGDGIVQATVGEQCEPATHDPSLPYGCSEDCQFTFLLCGDGKVDEGEQCDEGPANSNIADATCRTNCTRGKCGDGIIDSAEQCDDGNNRSFDGCSDQCVVEEGVCGDGFVQTALGEQCEPSTHDPDLPYKCSEDCQFVFLFCGDGKLDQGEECDEGLQNSNLPDARCRTNCTKAACGDGILDSAERCDDGNRLDGDGCDRMCMREGMVAPGMQEIVFPGQQPIGLPGQPPLSLATLLPLLAQMQQVPLQIPVTDTGPAAVAIIAAGSAAGFAFVRRRRK